MTTTLSNTFSLLAASQLAGHRHRRVFSQGALVAVLNPKTTLFFLAFLPQFVDPSRGSVALQLLSLGLLVLLMGIVSDSLYALTAGTLGNWLKTTRRFWRPERYIVGSVYVGLGLTAALRG